MRHQALFGRPLEQLLQDMDAQWYQKQWSGDAPVDLRDPMLGEIWIERLSQLAPDALSSLLADERLRNFPFAFRASFDPASPNCSVKDLLRKFSPAQLAILGAPHKGWLSPSWPPQKQAAAFRASTGRALDPLGDAEKSVILEWALLRQAAGDSAEVGEGWLVGEHAYEALAAQRLLDRDAPLSAAMRQWIIALAKKGFIAQPSVDRFAAHDAFAATQLFEKLSAAGRRAALASWDRHPEVVMRALEAQPHRAGELARHYALAVDLETDGRRIWEIGCSSGGVSTRLYDKAQGANLATALEHLSERIHNAPLIVGHNILAWDWPILAARSTFRSEPPIWDTLLVQYLLEPQAASHALGGTHHAESDAEAAMELFIKQISRLPIWLTAKMLTRRLGGADAVLQAIASALPHMAPLGRPAPEILDDPGHRPPRLLLATETQIRKLDWTPGVALVQANPQDSSPCSSWRLDLTRLEANLTAEQRRIPKIQTLLAVCRRAQKEGIALRREMLPPWILASPGLAAAVEDASLPPSSNGEIAVSPLPQSSEWWAQADVSKLRAALPYGPALIVKREDSVGGAAIPTHPSPRAALTRVVEPHAERWFVQDRPAQILDVQGGWRSFQTVTAPKSLAIVAQPSEPAKIKPILATRPHPALFPGSQDQAAYWMGLLEAFRETICDGAVPLLLIGSTTSQDMTHLLTAACAEVGLSEIKPSGRSRLEHLLRAKDRGFAMIDKLESWRDWRYLAGEAGLSLQPFIEALPIEEWFALMDAATRGDLAAADGRTSAAAAPETTVSEARLLEESPKLVARFLAPWLEETGLNASDHAAIILDSRADASGGHLCAFMNRRILAGAPWSSEEIKRLDTAFAPLRLQREEAPSDFAAMEQFLIANWGSPQGSGGNAVTGFKPTQALAIEAIRTRDHDVMVTLPTGEGKSVLFQVPALCRGLRNRRLTLVVSPLKALMRDQVERLHEQGFADSVDYVNSDRPWFEQREILQGVLDHRIILLYIAPERLKNAMFLDVLRRRMKADAGLEYVVFDEAHCVNQWGYEFRPDYFRAFSLLLQDLRSGTTPEPPPFLLLSATLTASDRRNLSGLLESGAKGSAKLPLAIRPDPATASNPLRAHIELKPTQVKGNLFDKEDFEPALAERLPHILEIIQKAQENRRETGQRSAVLVFVTRRAHADTLAGRLARASASDVESYHAGLDASTRDDIYTRFREGDLDVLVATKAFGMGMDIPDIHWVVHLSPSAYLEDYLQEVGRIGRGAAERKRAGFDKLSAVMLGSPADFENMRSLRAANELREPQIDEIEHKIIDAAEIIEGRKVAIVPQHGFEPYKTSAQMRANATRLRMALYWLEKAGHLAQLGMASDLLSVEIFPQRLAAVAHEDSQHGLVAQRLMSLAPNEDANAVAQDRAMPARDDGGLVDRLSELVGVRIDKPRQDHDQPPQEPRIQPSAIPSTVCEAVINIAQIRRRCQIPSLDDTMACLADLQSKGCLHLRWTLEFAKRPLLSEPPERIAALISSIGSAVRRLLARSTTQERMEFDPFDFLEAQDWGLTDAEDSSVASAKQKAEQQALLRRYRHAFLHGFRSLAGSSGIRLKQGARKADESAFWLSELQRSRHRDATERCEELLLLAPVLLSVFTRAGGGDRTEVEVSDVIRQMAAAHPKRRFRIAELEASLRLLSAMNLLSVQPDLVPQSHVLLLLDAPAGLGRRPDLIAELNDVNALAEIRTFAMEVFANLPDQARESFINGYFTKTDAEEMKVFLETQLGEIEGDGGEAEGFIATKRDQLRATKATEFFARYEDSEEPAQWEGVRHPFDQHLLVNAGPGAGKTSVLVGRIVHLIREQHVKPSEILVLAFNRAVVFEIKKRIRDLFRSLGYAAYASQVRVHTFHALARRSLDPSEGRSQGAAWENLLGDFAAKLAANATFRKQVADGCRCILIDEFQDVTDDVYSIIWNLYLGGGARAGVMAIGDDDQDILRWQRRTRGLNGGEFAETYFQKFKKDFGGDSLASLELSVNFRSGAEIVERSQKMISGFFAKTTKSRRLKQTLLRAASQAPNSQCERILSRGWAWRDTSAEILKACFRLRAENPGSLAVLCRTNDEVAHIHQLLAAHFPRLTVQSSENMRISDLRHVALWVDFLEAEAAKGDRALTEALRNDVLAAFRASAKIPEANPSSTPHVDLSALWGLCEEESVFPHLSTLIRFVRALQRDELQRLLGGRQGDQEVVVSTIHKVKGLEFDNVVVAPSRSSFGDRGASASALDNDAAEEARLLYVALTRARRRMTYFVGDRETAWGASQPRAFQGEAGQGQVLTGAHAQIDLGWAMRRSPFNQDPDDCQTYIERNVRDGDRIMLSGSGTRANMSLIHCSQSGARRQIGCVAKKFGAGSGDADLKVSAVIRYPIDDTTLHSTGEIVARQGWGYAVLIAGKLR